MKQCTKCHETKPLAQYHRDSQRSDGLYPSCKVCVLAARKARAKANPERTRENQRKWEAAYRERNPEKIAEKQRRRKSRGKDIVRQYAKDTGQELCLRCGHDGSNGNRLEWDHIDPATKSFRIADSYHRSPDTILAELTKCQRLCNQCHEAKTASGRALGK